MRISDLVGASVRLLATKRYIKHAANYSRGYAGFRDKLAAFLKDKVASPLVSCGKKDIPFTGGPLQGYWHAHIVHGKVVVVYDAAAETLSFYDVVEHDAFEGRGVKALADYLKSAKLEPYPISDAKLSPQDEVEFTQLLQFMKEQDRDVLESCLRGDMSGLKAFAVIVPLDWNAVVDSYGGSAALRRYIATIL